MVNQTEPQISGDDRTEAESLRTTLEQMRQQAELEVARLNRRLAEREYSAESPIASATERLALQQELTTLQQVLDTKEKSLDKITEECRRLEDALEDQHLAFDGLKQEVERRDLSLKAAWDEVNRLRQALTELQEQPSEPSPDQAIAHEKTAPLPPDVVHGARYAARRFIVWLLPGLLVLAGGALFVWQRGGIDPARLWDRPAIPSAPAVSSLPAAAPDLDSEPTLPVAGNAAALRPLQRDRLRNGQLGPYMALLDGGPFEMGQNSLSGEDFGPAHEVLIPPFLMGVHEVTFQQYDRFARTTGRPLPADYGWGRGNRPVVGVTWNEAQAYVAWLARETGRPYRLPSEAEWEFAARAGGRGSYWWGFGLEPGRAACFDCGSEWDNRSTAPVGRFPPSPFGLYDTAGNAMEWVADCYSPSYQDAPADGRARHDGDCRWRVARGGAFNKPATSMRTYVRAKFPPETRLDMLGFRLARDP